MASNSPITIEAKIAVNRFIPNQNERLFADFKGGANKSSSSFSPALAIWLFSASSRIISTTSSMVILPNNWLFLSVTATEIRSYFSNIWATLFSCTPACIGAFSSITSETNISSSRVISLVIGRIP